MTMLGPSAKTVFLLAICLVLPLESRSATPSQLGCAFDGVMYPRSSIISEYQNGDSCTITYCDGNGSVIFLSAPTCGTTPPIDTTTLQTTTVPTTTEEVTTQLPTDPAPGCTYEGERYPLQSTIKKWRNKARTVCVVTYCDATGEVVVLRQATCEVTTPAPLVETTPLETTTVPTTPVETTTVVTTPVETTTVPTTPVETTTVVTTPVETTTVVTTPAETTTVVTTPIETTTVPTTTAKTTSEPEEPAGCEYEGETYPLQSTIKKWQNKARTVCVVTYCDATGEVVVLRQATCQVTTPAPLVETTPLETTSVPTTPVETTTVVTTPVETTTVVTTPVETTTVPTTTAKTTSEPEEPASCEYEGELYPLQSTIKKWQNKARTVCVVTYCDATGEVVVLRQATCKVTTPAPLVETTPLETTTVPTTPVETTTVPTTPVETTTVVTTPVETTTVPTTPVETTSVVTTPVETTTVVTTPVETTTVVTTPVEATTVPTTTVKTTSEPEEPAGCEYEGETYPLQSTIKKWRNKARTVCVVTYCDATGEVVVLRQATCEVTTPAPLVETTPLETTTFPTTPVETTTVVTTPVETTTVPTTPVETTTVVTTPVETTTVVTTPVETTTVVTTPVETTTVPTTTVKTTSEPEEPAGCEYEGETYPLQSTIKKWRNKARTVCVVTYCDATGEVVVLRQATCQVTTPAPLVETTPLETTTVPTTPVETTTVPTTPVETTTVVTTPVETTTVVTTPVETTTVVTTPVETTTVVTTPVETTTVPTTTAKTTSEPEEPAGCEYEGETYPLQSTIKKWRNKARTVCVVTYCDATGEVVVLRQATCQVTTPAPLVETTPLETTTVPTTPVETTTVVTTPVETTTVVTTPVETTTVVTTPVETTTVVTTPIETTTVPTTTAKTTSEPEEPAGCEYEGEIYPLQSTIKKWRNKARTVCVVTYCDATGEVVVLRQAKCQVTTPAPLEETPPLETTTVPTTPLETTTVPTTPVETTTVVTTPVETTTVPTVSSTPAETTTVPLTTTTGTPIVTTSAAVTTTELPGCLFKGEYYAPSTEIRRNEVKRANLCYGKYCSAKGVIRKWENPNCFTTRLASDKNKAANEGCIIEGRFYPRSAVVPINVNNECVSAVCEPGFSPDGLIYWNTCA